MPREGDWEQDGRDGKRLAAGRAHAQKEHHDIGVKLELEISLVEHRGRQAAGAVGRAHLPPAARSEHAEDPVSDVWWPKVGRAAETEVTDLEVLWAARPMGGRASCVLGRAYVVLRRLQKLALGRACAPPSVASPLRLPAGSNNVRSTRGLTFACSHLRLLCPARPRPRSSAVRRRPPPAACMACSAPLALALPRASAAAMTFA